MVPNKRHLSKVPLQSLVYFVINKVPLEERKKMTIPQLLSLPIYHGTASGDGLTRFAVHVKKERFDPQKHGIIVFDSWTSENLVTFKSTEEAALAWKIKIDTIQPMFINYNLKIANSGGSIRAVNGRLIEKLADPKYSLQVREKTINALKNGAFVEPKIEDEKRDEQEDVSFLDSNCVIHCCFLLNFKLFFFRLTKIDAKHTVIIVGSLQKGRFSCITVFVEII